MVAGDDGPAELPRVAGGVVVVWRDKDRESVGIRGLEETLDVCLPSQGVNRPGS